MQNPKINLSRWSANAKLPAGISLNANTGVLSGTPIEPGEYTIPIQVETNYGKDTKNVTFKIESAAYPVYAKSYSTASSSKAYIWSNGAAMDSDGFRKINMPKVSRLVRTGIGFAAQAENGKWYVMGVGSGDVKYYGVSGFYSLDTLQEFPVSNVIAMSAGDYSTTDYFGYLQSGNTLTISKKSSQSGGTMTYGNVVKLSTGDNMQSTLVYLTADGIMYKTGAATTETWEGSIPVPVEQVRKIITASPKSGSYQYSYRAPFYITYSGELYQGTDKINFPYGKVRDIFGMQRDPPAAYFVVTENNELYAIGVNSAYQLGFTTSTKRTSLELVGHYDVKKILGTPSGSVMLTNDGKLYHTGTTMGTASSPTITRLIGTKHQGFVQVLPNKKVHDILYTVGCTLVATIEE